MHEIREITRETQFRQQIHFVQFHFSTTLKDNSLRVRKKSLNNLSGKHVHRFIVDPTSHDGALLRNYVSIVNF